jgi:CDP-diacylglycerol--serine O-phosphatidyltransferase
MFSIPNIITAINMLSGVVAIILTFSGRLDLAPFAIFAGAVLDFFDGFLARKLGLQGELGKQLDSLADMITFGVAPGLMMLNVIVVSIYAEGPYYGMNFNEYAHFQMNNWVNAMFHGVPNSLDASISFLPFVALLIPFFSMFRLAKFNIDVRQTDSFIGLPTPLNTIFFCFFPLVLLTNFDNLNVESRFLRYLIDPYVISALVSVMSLLLVSELPLFSLKFKHLGWKGNEVRFLFLIGCLLFIALFLVWAIPLIVILYLIFSLILQKFNSKKNEIQS